MIHCTLPDDEHLSNGFEVWLLPKNLIAKFHQSEILSKCYVYLLIGDLVKLSEVHLLVTRLGPCEIMGTFRIDM